MLRRAGSCLLLAVVIVAGAACSSDDSSGEVAALDPTETVGSTNTVTGPPVDTTPPTCLLVSPEEVGVALGIAVSPLETAPTPERCEFTSPTREPVLGVQVERGQTLESVTARIAASGDEVERIGTGGTWSAGRGIATALVEDAFLQVVLPASTLPEAERRSGAFAVLERAAARLRAFLPASTFDVAGRSYVDNILAKAEAGEWSVDEGIVATLELLAGARDERSVLRVPSELESLETTGVMAMAHEVARTGTDPALRARASELLDELTFTRSELDAIARPATRRAASARGGSVKSERRPAAARQAPADCSAFYGAYSIPDGVGECLLVHTQTTGGVSFRIYEPSLEGVDAGWADTFVVPAVTLVRETIDETVEQTFVPLGSLPGEMLIVLAAAKHHRAAMQAVPDEEGSACTVTAYLGSQNFAPADFKQLLAHEFAHCFQNATFPEQQVAYPDRRWREEGLAEYLSAVAYPETNEERRFVDLLRATEVSTATVLSRAYDNVVWFHHLRESLGSDEAILDLVRGGPTSGTIDDQQSYVASWPEIEERHHAFVLATTDGTVPDLDGSTYPPATSFNARGETLAEGLRFTAMFRPLGVGKFVLTVPAGMAANVEVVSGDNATVSARPFAAPGDWFPLVSGEELLAPCDEPASFVVVASSASQETTFTMEVTTLEEYDCEECVVGEWRLELPEPFLTSTAPYLGQRDSVERSVSGNVDLSIFDDGSIEVDIDSYEEVLEFELYDLRSVSRGRAAGRWQIESGQLSAAYTGFGDLETTTSTTGAGFSGTQNVPPSHTLISRPGPYACDEQRLVYASPDGPIVSYRRR